MEHFRNIAVYFTHLHSIAKLSAIAVLWCSRCKIHRYVAGLLDHLDRSHGLVGLLEPPDHQDILQGQVHSRQVIEYIKRHTFAMTAQSVH